MPNPPSSGLPNPASYDTSVAGVVRDDVTGLMWQREQPDVAYAWENAKAYCAELALAGNDDWRLPTRIELVSIVDFTRSDPSADVAVFPGASGIPSTSWRYWTSTPLVGDEAPPRSWVVSFFGGATDTAEQASERNARCVRTEVAPLPISARYSLDPAGDTATDTGTGLTWQRTSSSDTYTFDQARAYCASLTLQGAGWRVPSLNELQTLVLETRTGPAIDGEVFLGVPPGDTFWTSSMSAGTRPNIAWFISFAAGYPGDITFDGQGVAARRNARCVR
jgi:hypothetical protein